MGAAISSCLASCCVGVVRECAFVIATNCSKMRRNQTCVGEPHLKLVWLLVFSTGLSFLFKGLWAPQLSLMANHLFDRVEFRLHVFN